VCVSCVALCAFLIFGVLAYGWVLSEKGLGSVVTNYLVLETACVTLLGPFLLWGSSLFTVMQKANILAAIHERRLL
jgi:hypothetical protein